jgi:spore photoproduct lyase
MEAARKVAGAGYPLGFIVAPIYRHEAWKEGYHELFERLSEALKGVDIPDLTFELISIGLQLPKVIQNYPKTKLELDETKRKYKYRYGIGVMFTKPKSRRTETAIRGYIVNFPQRKFSILPEKTHIKLS